MRRVAWLFLLLIVVALGVFAWAALVSAVTAIVDHIRSA